MTEEANIQARTLLACGALPGIRLFRNTVGTGWQGEVVARHANGNVTLLRPRFVTFGLAPGSHDLIGWRTVNRTGEYTAQMVGFEIKRKGGRVDPDQTKFHKALTAAGGLSAVIRDPAEALELLCR